MNEVRKGGESKENILLQFSCRNDGRFVIFYNETTKGEVKQ